MKRRGFLRNLGLGLGAVVAAPTLIKEMGSDKLVADVVTFGDPTEKNYLGPAFDNEMVWTETGRLHAVATGTFEGGSIIHFGAEVPEFSTGDSIMIEYRGRLTSATVVSTGPKFIQFAAFRVNYDPIKVGEQVTVIRTGSEFKKQ